MYPDQVFQKLSPQKTNKNNNKTFQKPNNLSISPFKKTNVTTNPQNS